MKRYALSHKNGDLKNIIENSDLYIKIEDARSNIRKEERIFKIDLAFGTHPELKNKPHVIIMRERERAIKTKDSKRLQPTYDSAVKKFNELNLKMCDGNIVAVSKIADYDTKEVFYDSAEIIERYFDRRTDK